tara:strand:- start:116 stop:301 length:186 start_codon:yes stop_codon:yes gene_type:complete
MIPDRARLGLGTINLLSQLQTLEKVSADALVARAVAMYHKQKLLTTRDTHGQTNKTHRIKQ